MSIAVAAGMLMADDHVLAGQLVTDPAIKIVQSFAEPVLTTRAHTVVQLQIVVRIRAAGLQVVIEVSVEHHAGNVGRRHYPVLVAKQVAAEPLGIELPEGPAVGVPRRFAAEVEGPQACIVALSQHVLGNDGPRRASPRVRLVAAADGDRVRALVDAGHAGVLSLPE